ncbi:MAG: hypothetical protein Q9163_001726 [Psora crenata]
MLKVQPATRYDTTLTASPITQRAAIPDNIEDNWARGICMVGRVYHLPTDSHKPVFAVKFIHKDYAIRHGRLTKKQLDLEISLHQHLGGHPHIVQLFMAGDDPTWRWIAMELAEGGDLFDKIESDVGVGEDIAHLYFTQLISAVLYMHSKHIGHRDIKPENILLSADGNLKIADFGLATLFKWKGETKLCTTSCGSPPYTAPEVVTCDYLQKRKLNKGYQGNLVDIWSCAVVLFVLLVGNTPWDEPLERSYEFNEYVKTDGRPDDELWHNLPQEALSLLRGMMRIEPSERLSLNDIQQHPWFRRHNPYLGSGGRLENPVGLATKMFESMKIDFSQDPMASQRSQRSADAMDVDGTDSDVKVSSTNEIMFDWETVNQASNGRTAANSHSNNGLATSQNDLDEQLVDEPCCSQFSSMPRVPLTRTQFARQFKDILPSHSLTRFFSFWPAEQLHALLIEAFGKLVVPIVALSDALEQPHGDQVASLKVRATLSSSDCMTGNVIIERMHGVEGQVLQVNFVKAKGDPVEWRRLFKKVVVLCKDAVFRPDESIAMLSQASVQ